MWREQRGFSSAPQFQAVELGWYFRGNGHSKGVTEENPATAPHKNSQWTSQEGSKAIWEGKDGLVARWCQSPGHPRADTRCPTSASDLQQK